MGQCSALHLVKEIQAVQQQLCSIFPQDIVNSKLLEQTLQLVKTFDAQKEMQQ